MKRKTASLCRDSSLSTGFLCQEVKINLLTVKSKTGGLQSLCNPEKQPKLFDCGLVGRCEALWSVSSVPHTLSSLYTSWAVHGITCTTHTQARPCPHRVSAIALRKHHILGVGGCDTRRRYVLSSQPSLPLLIMRLGASPPSLRPSPLLLRSVGLQRSAFTTPFAQGSARSFTRLSPPP